MSYSKAQSTIAPYLLQVACPLGWSKRIHRSISDSSVIYNNGAQRKVRLFEGLEAAGFPLPKAGCPRWSIADALGDQWGESEAAFGDATRDHCDLGIGSAEYPQWNDALKAYIERDLVQGMYPDDHLVIFRYQEFLERGRVCNQHDFVGCGAPLGKSVRS